MENPAYKITYTNTVMPFGLFWLSPSLALSLGWGQVSPLFQRQYKYVCVFNISMAGYNCFVSPVLISLIFFKIIFCFHSHCSSFLAHFFIITQLLLPWVPTVIIYRYYRGYVVWLISISSRHALFSEELTWRFWVARTSKALTMLLLVVTFIVV